MDAHAVAEHTLEVEVLTPEGEVFSGEVEMVSTSTAGVDRHPRSTTALSWPRWSRPSCVCTGRSPRSSATPRARAGCRSSPTSARPGRGGDRARRARQRSDLRSSSRGRAGAQRGRGGQRRAAEGPERAGGLLRDRRQARLGDGRAGLARAADRLRHLPAGGDPRAAGFVKGWLEAREIEVRRRRGAGAARAAAEGRRARDGRLHGHFDVVPGLEQFDPRVEGDRLFGRGAYDMKGALAAMMLRPRGPRRAGGVACASARPRRGVRGGGRPGLRDELVDAGYIGDFAITGEPTDLHIGIQAKGVLAMRISATARRARLDPMAGRQRRAQGDRRCSAAIESLPFARETSELFDRPSINLGRIFGGDALNKVPDTCVIDVDIRYLPDQEPEEILAQVEDDARQRGHHHLHRPPAIVDATRRSCRALRAASPRTTRGGR